MIKKKLLFLTVFFVSAFFLAGSIYAGSDVKETFKIKTKEYTQHKYNPVTLSHKKHVVEYGANCGSCHHDDKGKPLTSLKAGDHVKRCIECHDKAGLKPRGKKLNKKEKMHYQAEAMHKNCKSCHKKHNKDVKKKTGKKGKAPVSCKKCHIGGKIK